MPATPDCSLLRDVSGTSPLRALFDSRALLQTWLDVEAALAEAEVGVIRPDAAERIRARGREVRALDMATVLHVRAALDPLEGSLVELIAAQRRRTSHLAVRAREVAGTPIAERTDGPPITCAQKVAVWLDELGRTRARLAEPRSELEALPDSTAYLGEASALAVAAADRVLPAVETTKPRPPPRARPTKEAPWSSS